MVEIFIETQLGFEHTAARLVTRHLHFLMLEGEAFYTILPLCTPMIDDCLYGDNFGKISVILDIVCGKNVLKRKCLVTCRNQYQSRRRAENQLPYCPVFFAQS